MKINLSTIKAMTMWEQGRENDCRKVVQSWAKILCFTSFAQTMQTRNKRTK